jgi:DNA-binding transcriptional ArsR family regulator
MDDRDAIGALHALGQEHRLGLFRLLIRHLPEGLAAGEIAAGLGLAPSALSFHLSQLQDAGLIRCRRDGRRLIYAADLAGFRGLLAYLTDDCCQGRPELCGGFAASSHSAGKAVDDRMDQP